MRVVEIFKKITRTTALLTAISIVLNSLSVIKSVRASFGMYIPINWTATYTGMDMISIRNIFLCSFHSSFTSHFTLLDTEWLFIVLFVFISFKIIYSFQRAHYHINFACIHLCTKCLYPHTKCINFLINLQAALLLP